LLEVAIHKMNSANKARITGNDIANGLHSPRSQTIYH
jgi:hypothetical protein